MTCCDSYSFLLILYFADNLAVLFSFFNQYQSVKVTDTEDNGVGSQTTAGVDTPVTE